MSKLSQREATYNTIINELSNNGVSFQDGSDVKKVISSDMKKKIKEALMNSFKNGNVNHAADFNTKLNSDTELSKYCSGLISNWIKKDPRLNGNTKYQIVNKGARAGQGDLQVKEIKKLLKASVGTSAEEEVLKALNTRLAEVKAAKVPDLGIDIEALPENLRHLVK